MTEYDFSPDAYDKHMKKLKMVSDWVLSQSEVTNEYGNPFKPPEATPEPTRESRKSTKSPTRSRSSTASAPSSTTTPIKPVREKHVRSHTTRDPRSKERQAPKRSQTMPNPEKPNRSEPHPPRGSHRDKHSKRSDHHRKDPIRNKDHLRSSSTGTVGSSGDVQGRRTIRLHPNLLNDHNLIILPPPQADEQYVIIPPPGRRVERMVYFPICHSFSTYLHDSLVVYQGQSSNRQRAPRHENREPTLLKRIFGGFSLTGGSRESSSSRRRSSY